jgi:hypothetical protein
MSRLLACIAVVVGTGPLFACINDVELPIHEREFRSQYRTQAAPPPIASPEPTNRPSTGALIGAGAVLLGVAATLALRPVRARI